MPPELRALTTAQGGVFTRRQAVAVGCTERELKTRTGANGDWVVVRRGAYATRQEWAAADEHTRYRMRVRAALLVTAEPSIASHSSSAALLGLPLRPRWLTLVHVTRPGVSGGRTEGGVKHHLAGYGPQDLAACGDLTVTGLARTAIDLAREYGLEDGVIAADAALRLGAQRSQLSEALARMECWPHVTRARAAAALADPGAESVGETLTRLLVLELRIGVPETQFEVVDGGRRALVDLRVGRHLIEFDGQVKYRTREHGGVADAPGHEVVWEEKRREDWLRSLGYGMSRVAWEDLFGTRREQTKQRLLREFRASQRRFGHLG